MQALPFISKNMKFFLYTFLIITITLLSSCVKHNEMLINGKFKNFKQGKFFIYSYSPEWDGLDTIHVDEGEFHFSKTITDTTIVTIQFTKEVSRILVAIPGKEINIKGDATSLSEMEISGSEENELLSTFHKETTSASPSVQRAKAEAFIKEHPESYASFVLFQKYFLYKDKLDLEKIDKYLKLLTKSSPERLQLQNLKAQLQSLLNCRPGKNLPSFNATTLKNEKINNNFFKGKWILINFWSTWGREYSRLAGHSHKVLRHYGKKIEAFNICLDGDTIGCNIEIRRDSITGYNVCDLKSWESPLVKKFGVRYLPSNILVDPKGKIIARDIKEEDLNSELKKYIK